MARDRRGSGDPPGFRSGAATWAGAVAAPSAPGPRGRLHATASTTLGGSTANRGVARVGAARPRSVLAASSSAQTRRNAAADTMPVTQTVSLQNSSTSSRARRSSRQASASWANVGVASPRARSMRVSVGYRGEPMWIPDLLGNGGWGAGCWMYGGRRRASNRCGVRARADRSARMAAFPRGKELRGKLLLVARVRPRHPVQGRLVFLGAETVPAVGREPQRGREEGGKPDEEGDDDEDVH